MSPRRWPLALFALIVGVVVGAGGLWLIDSASDDTATDTQSDEVETSTAVAELRDLRRFTEWDGTLAAGTSTSISSASRGTLTRTVDGGTLVSAGDVVAEIDGSPVVALYGTVPQFRSLSVNVDAGADIRQLEENLVALGFDPGGTVVVDETFTAETGAMVLLWETELGLPTPDEVVPTGQVAFIEGPSEVSNGATVGSQVNAGQAIVNTVTLAEVGFVALSEDAPNGAVVEVVVEEVVAGDGLLRWELPLGAIQLAVGVDEVATFEIGREVEVELPDSQVVAAQVTEVSDVARSVQDGGNTVTVVDVTIQPDEPIESIFTAGPVTIRAETDVTAGAVLVPVRALVALAEGGHAVEIEGRGLAGVELGAFDEGWVEIVGGTIEAGDTVIVPV